MFSFSFSRLLISEIARIFELLASAIFALQLIIVSLAFFSQFVLLD